MNTQDKNSQDKNSQALDARLQELGFEQVQFDPKINNRFIVKIEGIPSYIIKGVRFPTLRKNGWDGCIELECYNPLDAKIEEGAMNLINRDLVDIKIQLLSPTAHVDTDWDIVGKNGSVHFGNLNWSEEGKANSLFLSFDIETANVSYPTQN